MAAIKIRWVEGKMMVGSDSNGISIVIGPSPDPEYKWSGVKPSELLLLSVASCTAYDVIEILTKQRQTIEDLKVTCSGDAKGAIDPEKLEKAIQLSEEKYCSVSNTLKKGVSITREFEIINEVK